MLAPQRRHHRARDEALSRLAYGIAKATRQIKDEFQDAGPPRFLMIVQQKATFILWLVVIILLSYLYFISKTL